MTVTASNEAVRSEGASLAYVLLLVAMITWAGNLVVGRALAGAVGPFTLSWMRWAIAFAVVLPFTWRELVRHRTVLGRDRYLLLVLGIFFTCSNAFCYLALQSTTAVNASLINAVGPLLIFAASTALLAERFRWQHLLGLGLSLGGVVVVILRGETRALLDLELNRGDFRMLAGVATWTAYSVMLRRRPAELSAAGLVAALFGIGVVSLAPFMLWEALRGAALAPTPGALIGILYVGLLPSVVAILCWNRAVAVVGPSRASIFTYLMPLFAASLALFFLGEDIRAFHLWGGALIFLGLTIALARR